MKQIIYYYLCLKVLLKAAACGYLLIAGAMAMPKIIYILCALLVVAGVVVAVRQFVGRGKPNEMTMFFATEGFVTIFNLAFVSAGTIVETSWLDMLVTGSVLDIILAAVIVFVAIRSKTAYINMGKQRFQQVPQQSEASSKLR